jgi:hypothetical protein
MPTDQILELLIAERDKLNRALEALQGSTARRRGRAPKNAMASMPTVAANGRRGMSAAARKAQSRRMKAFWAKRRKGAGK